MHGSFSASNTDVARKLFDANGQDIVWAVIDSGIDGSHPHFRKHRNLELQLPLAHHDFTVRDGEGAPLTDVSGNGTRTAGLIAGELTNAEGSLFVERRVMSGDGSTEWEKTPVSSIAGLAPRCKLVSFKVLDDAGRGFVSNLITAIARVQEINGYGRRLLIHGVNLGLAYEYDPEWFACGQSPLCVEVDRLVRSGVVVVVAAGNTGYGLNNTAAQGAVPVGVPMGIRDPGNAELAMTVGSTHFEMPHIWGVSYFSAKGPTLDGRMKPDVVAPGEKVISCAVRSNLTDAGSAESGLYVESSGTSLATAHVSGTIASFLSVQRQLIGQPELVKRIFLDSALDLRRMPTHQGRGLIDLARALASDLAPYNVARVNWDVAARLAEQVDEGTAAPRSAEPRVSVPTPAVATPAIASTKQPPRPLRLMCSYAHEDASMLDRLRRALATLRRQGLIELWDDQQTPAGESWEKGVHQNLDQAEVIILLISSDFIASDYCYNVELAKALERYDENTVKVIPVIVRDTDWEGTEFEKRKIKVLPLDGKPVMSWDNKDAAWLDVARGVGEVVKKAQPKR